MEQHRGGEGEGLTLQSRSQLTGTDDETLIAAKEGLVLSFFRIPFHQRSRLGRVLRNKWGMGQGPTTTLCGNLDLTWGGCPIWYEGRSAPGCCYISN